MRDENYLLPDIVAEANAVVEDYLRRRKKQAKKRMTFLRIFFPFGRGRSTRKN